MFSKIKLPLYLTVGASLAAGIAHANPTVSGATISWPDDGWYQVQDAATFQTICEGGTSCDVSVGTYIVVNHTTGQRFNDIVVSGSTTPTTPVSTITVTGSTISWPDNGWYQVQDATTYATLCEGGTSCDVNAGTYLLINHTTGERFTDIVVSGSTTPPTGTDVSVSGSTISWPNDGWYQVQNATTFETVCEGGTSCDVSDGTYFVINHTTGERFTDIQVGGSTGPVTPPTGVDTITVDGSTIRWPDNGWYQIQNATTFQTACEGGLSCVVDNGTYFVINHSTGSRDTVEVGDVAPPVSTETVDVTFEIEVPFIVSNALQVRLMWGDTNLTAAWLIDESWAVTGALAENAEQPLSVVFSDDNGGTTLASFDATYRTSSTDGEVYRITADQFDSERWDSDSDGTSNLAELRVGTDPFVVEVVSPTGPTSPAALNISTYSGYDVELFWPRATDDVIVMGYDIYRNGELLESMVDALSYYDPTTEPEREYIYAVYAVDNDGFRSPPVSATALTPADQPVSGISAQTGTITGNGGLARWIIGDGLTTTNGTPTGGYCTSREGAGSGVGILDASLRSASGRTQYDAFDLASLMWINGEQVGGFLRAVTDTTSNYATVPVAGLQVTAQYHAVSSSATLRNYTTLRNDSGSDIFAVINFTSNFGSDGGTSIYSTSSDNTSFEASDRWVITDDYSSTGGDPANTTVFYGPGSPDSPVVFAQERAFSCYSSNGLNARVDVIVPAGSTRSLLFFHQMSSSSVNAVVESAQFDSTPALGSPLVEGLSQEQLDEVVNWDF